MDLDRLREIEGDPLAPGQQQALGDAEDQRVHDQRGGMGRSFQQPAEAFGPRAVEDAFTVWGRREARGEIALQRRDDRGIESAVRRAPSLADKLAYETVMIEHPTHDALRASGVR